ncbi:MAG: hypothetical protein JWO06_2914, partial [Bacteroidota bacterium]|nr:hypothetical protein [Bacteroidota bacterium]
VFIAIFLLTFLAGGAQSYKIAGKIPVEGEGGWDYLVADAATGRLFVSHGNVVNVVDAKSGKLIHTIPDTKGVHGIALAPELNKGFISNGRDSSVTVFNLTTYEVVALVYVTGKNPDAILYDPFSKKVFVFNGRTSNVTVIDAKSNAVVGTIPLPGKPEFAVTNEAGKVYVNIEDKNQIVVIDANTLKAEQIWPIAPGESASGLAIDNKNHRLFAVCDNKMMVVVNADSGKVVTTVPIGEGPDAAAFDPALNRAYSSNGDGTITVVQEEGPNKFVVLENIVTKKGARTMTVDTKTHHLYLPAADYGEKPEATKENPHPRPTIKSGSFIVLDVEQVK